MVSRVLMLDHSGRPKMPQIRSPPLPQTFDHTDNGGSQGTYMVRPEVRVLLITLATLLAMNHSEWTTLSSSLSIYSLHLVLPGGLLAAHAKVEAHSDTAEKATSSP